MSRDVPGGFQSPRTSTAEIAENAERRHWNPVDFCSIVFSAISVLSAVLASCIVMLPQTYSSDGAGIACGENHSGKPFTFRRMPCVKTVTSKLISSPTLHPDNFR